MFDLRLDLSNNMKEFHRRNNEPKEPDPAACMLYNSIYVTVRTGRTRQWLERQMELPLPGLGLGSAVPTGKGVWEPFRTLELSHILIRYWLYGIRAKEKILVRARAVHFNTQ